MLMVGVQLALPVLRLRGWPLALALVTTLVSVITNMAVGFAAGLAGTYLVRQLIRRRLLTGNLPAGSQPRE